jgi:hypothetical protein
MRRSGLGSTLGPFKHAFGFGNTGSGNVIDGSYGYGFQDGVMIAHSDVKIVNNSIAEFLRYGIDIFASAFYSTVIGNNVQSGSAGTAGTGIWLEATSCRVADNYVTVTGAVPGGTHLGIKVTGEKNIVMDNSVLASGGAVSNIGILIEAIGDHAIIDGNQTNGMAAAGDTAISDQSAASTVGANNRDDA